MRLPRSSPGAPHASLPRPSPGAPGSPQFNFGVGPSAGLDQADACRDRREAWAKYEAGQEEAATKLFEGRSAFAQWDLWRMVLRIFRHRNVEYVVAPYLAWAQVRVCFFPGGDTEKTQSWCTCNATRSSTSTRFTGPRMR